MVVEPRANGLTILNACLVVVSAASQVNMRMKSSASLTRVQSGRGNDGVRGSTAGVGRQGTFANQIHCRQGATLTTRSKLCPLQLMIVAFYFFSFAFSKSEVLVFSPFFPMTFSFSFNIVSLLFFRLLGIT